MLFGSKNQPCKLIVHRFWSLQQTSQYAKYQTYTNSGCILCCSVAVQKMVVWKYEMNSISIYIDIELFFAYGKGFLRTATLQHCNTMLSFNRFRWKVFTPFSFSGEKKSKKVDKKFVNRNDNVVPLHSKDWTRTGLQPTFDIFRVWDAVHVITREMRKKRPLPANSLQSPNPDETLEEENRGRMKRQKTHIRSLTDLYTPNSSPIC